MIPIITHDGAVRPRVARPVFRNVGLEEDVGPELPFVGVVEHGGLID